MENNLSSYESSVNSFKYLLTNQNNSNDFYAYYSYDKPQLNNLRVRVRIKEKDKQALEIVDVEHELVLFEETIVNEYLGWKVKNLYWVGPEDGFVWKSIQYVSPKLPPFTFEVTKKTRHVAGFFI